MSAARDLTGQRFGKLTVLERIGSRNKNALWKCLCICGEEVEVITRSLTSGNTRSCGCAYKHGGKVTHGMSGTPEYTAWRKLKVKGLLPKEWSSFSHFLRDVGKKPSPSHVLTRYDNRIAHNKTNTYWRQLNDDNHSTGDFDYGYIDLSTGTYRIAGEAEAE